MIPTPCNIRLSDHFRLKRQSLEDSMKVSVSRENSEGLELSVTPLPFLCFLSTFPRSFSPSFSLCIFHNFSPQFLLFSRILRFISGFVSRPVDETGLNNKWRPRVRLQPERRQVSCSFLFLRLLTIVKKRRAFSRANCSRME